MRLSLLSFLLSFLAGLGSSLRALYLLLAPRFAERSRPSSRLLSRGLPRLAVLIAAHNEAAVIPTTVSRVWSELQSTDAVFVVADNCVDETAEAAEAVGALVYRRDDPAHVGKRFALRWLLESARNEVHAFDALVLLDADAFVEKGFFDEMRQMLVDGHVAVQGFVRPTTVQHSSVSAIAGYSELLAQCIDDATRTRLGWSVPLRGTGMVFRTQLFEEVIPVLRTRVEDLELSLLLAAKEVRVAFAPQAVISDPKPTNLQQVARQRGRWLQGHTEVLRYYWRDILWLLIWGDIGTKTLVLSLLLKPKSLVFALKALLLMLLLLFPLPLDSLRLTAIVLLSAALLIDIGYYLFGLLFVDNPGLYGKALLMVPLYVVMWLWAMLISLVSKDPWLRARD